MSHVSNSGYSSMVTAFEDLKVSHSKPRAQGLIHEIAEEASTFAGRLRREVSSYSSFFLPYLKRDAATGIETVMCECTDLTRNLEKIGDLSPDLIDRISVVLESWLNVKKDIMSLIEIRKQDLGRRETYIAEKKARKESRAKLAEVKEDERPSRPFRSSSKSRRSRLCYLRPDERLRIRNVGHLQENLEKHKFFFDGMSDFSKRFETDPAYEKYQSVLKDGPWSELNRLMKDFFELKNKIDSLDPTMLDRDAGTDGYTSDPTMQNANDVFDCLERDLTFFMERANLHGYKFYEDFQLQISSKKELDLIFKHIEPILDMASHMDSENAEWKSLRTDVDSINKGRLSLNDICEERQWNPKLLKLFGPDIQSLKRRAEEAFSRWSHMIASQPKTRIKSKLIDIEKFVNASLDWCGKWGQKNPNIWDDEKFCGFHSRLNEIEGGRLRLEQNWQRSASDSDIVSLEAEVDHLSSHCYSAQQMCLGLTF